MMDVDNQSQLLREMLRGLERKMGLVDDSAKSCCGISLAQCHALVEIGRASDLSLNSLADMMNLDKSSVSRSVDHLVRRGYALRKTDEKSRRKIVIRLTSSGSDLFTRIEKDMTRYYSAVLDKIEPGKRAQVIESVGLLLDAIERADLTCE
jgi:DNA-binding MarR family transcriptional regulator